MSKMSDVRFLVAENKDMKRVDLIKLVADKFAVKSNTANMYIYKTLKALEAGPAKVAKAKARIESVTDRSSKSAEQIMKQAEKSIADKKLDEQLKSERLVMMKEVSSKQKARDAESEKIRAELAAYEVEIDDYIASGAMPQIFRKELISL
jgi:DNA polymerase II large subunit